GDRIWWLVEQFHAGNITAAAKAWQTTQPTLTRITRGEVENPRTDILTRIAMRQSTTVDWLLTGRGEAPSTAIDVDGDLPAETIQVVEAHDAARGAYLNWRYLLMQVPLAAETRTLLEQLPFSLAMFRLQFRSLEGQTAKEERAQ